MGTGNIAFKQVLQAVGFQSDHISQFQKQQLKEHGQNCSLTQNLTSSY